MWDTAFDYVRYVLLNVAPDHTLEYLKHWWIVRLDSIQVLIAA